MPTATIDEFDLDIRLQEVESIADYPPPTYQITCPKTFDCFR